MRVLVLSQHYWPESFRINEVVYELRRAGCEVCVLTGQPNYPDGVVQAGYRAWGLGAETHPQGYTIYRVPLVPRGNGSARRLVANYLSFIASASVLGPWVLRGQRFDVIFVYGTSPILQAVGAVVLKWVKKAALVTWVQDLWPQSLQVTGFVKNDRALAAVSVVVRWIYTRSDLLLAQSRAFVPAVAAMAGDTPVEYHPNPGESESESESESISATAADREPAPDLTLAPAFNVVFAGNLGKAQALDTVLAAAELLRDCEDVVIVLVGSGARADALKRQVAERRLTNVRLPGRFPSRSMPGILAQASALLVSLAKSPIMSQTVPSKIQTYLAAGRPIVASLDGEGARVVTEAGAGVACAAEDAQALAEAILSLRRLGDADRRAMGEAGRRYHQDHFDPARLAVRLHDRFVQLRRVKAGHRTEDPST